MKHKGSQTEFMQQRNLELALAFNMLLREAKFIRLNDILTKLVNSPASRFYVSGARMQAVMRRMRRDPKGWDKNMVPERARMFRDLVKVHERMHLAYPKAKDTELCERAVMCAAPSFYLTPKSAKVILHHIKHRTRGYGL